MLTNQLLSYYNHLLAASLMYLTMVDPLKDIANTLIGHVEKDHHRLTSLVLADASQDQDYYETLGVRKDATKHEIHKAFRQLAKKYHPDKNKDKSASDEFIKIFKAYETLSDEKKRKEYDERANEHQQGSAHSWTTSNMNDFDMNEFFRQYEDQFMKHAQFHQQSHSQQHNYDHYHNHQHQYQHHHQHQHQHQHPHHQQHHEKFQFHGINLDDLFNDIDDEEVSSFGRWFDSSSHNHNHFHEVMDGHFGDGASFFGFPSNLHDSIHNMQQHQNIYGSHQQSGGLSCQTTTRNVNGVVMTQTSCS